MASLTVSSNVSNATLSRYVTENPRVKSDELTAKARWNNIAAKVCTVAFFVIFAVAITITMGVALPIPPALMVGLVLGTVPLQFANAHFRTRHVECTMAGAAERGKANELEKIQNWTTPQIEAFLSEHRISLANFPMNQLQKIDSKEPLRALLPLIARYRYWHQQTETQFIRYQANLHNEAVTEHLKSLGRSQAWKILEERVVPAALQAALMLQVIHQPTLELEWENLGQCKMKSFEQRTFDRWLDQTDDYFVFKDSNRQKLTLDEICGTIEPLKIDDLRLKLFP